MVSNSCFVPLEDKHGEQREAKDTKHRRHGAKAQRASAGCGAPTSVGGGGGILHWWCPMWVVSMRQRILGSHTPPCHRRMVITTLFSVFLAALQRTPVLYHTTWLLTVLWLWSSGH